MRPLGSSGDTKLAPCGGSFVTLGSKRPRAPREAADEADEADDEDDEDEADEEGGVVDAGTPTTDGAMTDGSSSPAKPARVDPQPKSTTSAEPTSQVDAVPEYISSRLR